MKLKHFKGQFRGRRKLLRRARKADAALKGPGSEVARAYYGLPQEPPAVTAIDLPGPPGTVSAAWEGEMSSCAISLVPDAAFEAPSPETMNRYFGPMPMEVLNPGPFPLVEQRVEMQFAQDSLTPDQVLEHFYAGLRPNTKKAYQQDMEALAKFLTISVHGTVGTLLRCNQAQISGMAARWLESMAGLSPATRARRLVTLRKFGKAGRSAGILSWNLELKGPPIQNYRDTRGVPEEGVHKMFAACGEGLAGMRDRLILFLLSVMGLRRHEVAGLSLDDYDEPGRRIRIVGKRGKEKWLHVPQPVARAIDEFQRHDDLTQTHQKGVPLVHSLAQQNLGERLTGAGVNHIVHQIAERAGVKAWAHALRHSTVTVALNRKHPIQDVRSLSRHEKLETVQLYDDNRQQRDATVSDDLAELYDSARTNKT